MLGQAWKAGLHYGPSCNLAETDANVYYGVDVPAGRVSLTIAFTERRPREPLGSAQTRISKCASGRGIPRAFESRGALRTERGASRKRGGRIVAMPRPPGPLSPLSPPLRVVSVLCTQGSWPRSRALVRELGPRERSRRACYQRSTASDSAVAVRSWRSVDLRLLCVHALCS